MFYREVSHPLAAMETTFTENEIPVDPPKRFLSRVTPKEKGSDDKSGDEKKSKYDRSKDRSRSRSRDRGDRRGGDRDRRNDDRNRDWKPRDRDGSSQNPRYGRSNFSATGRKIKGRGRVVR